MRIERPKCKAAYKVDETKISDKGASVRCQKFQSQFFVKKETILIVDTVEQTEEVGGSPKVL